MDIIMPSLFVLPPDPLLTSKFNSFIPMLSNTNMNYIQFSRVVKLWNALPVIDVSLSTPVLKLKSKLVFVVAF